MAEVFFSKGFIEYKSGFANGVIDFIINPTIDVSSFEIDENTNIWDIGYVDAIRYYQLALIDSYDMSLDLSNMSVVLSEFYIKRVSKINEIYGTSIPAFTLLLKPNDYN